MNKYCFFLILLFSFVSVISAQELALVREKGDIGFIDKSGAFVVEPQFKSARSFSEGYAGVEKKNSWGFVNTSGEWVIDAIYERVKDFNSGYALVLKDGKWNYIDKQGIVLSTPETDKYFDFQEGVAFFRQSDKVGLIGIDGKVIAKPKYHKIQAFVDGHAVVKVGTFFGMINQKDEVTIPIAFQALGDYSAKGVWGNKNGVLGLIVDGNFNPIEGASKIWNFGPGSDLAPAKKKGKVGFINNQGEWVIKPAFREVKGFNQGLAPVSKGRTWSIIDETGKVLMPFRFEEMESFSDDGLAAVKMEDWGFMNTKGTVVIPTKYFVAPYTSISTNYLSQFLAVGFNNGIARVKYRGKWGYLDTSGNLIGNKWFQNAEIFSK